MHVSTAAKNHTTEAALTSLNAALTVAFNTESVRGMNVVGKSVWGINILFLAYRGKGPEPHEVSVEENIDGDPIKDTSGPSFNILIKLMSIISLVIAPLF